MMDSRSMIKFFINVEGHVSIVGWTKHHVSIVGPNFLGFVYFNMLTFWRCELES